MKNSNWSNLAQKIFNINFKRFQIPERRLSSISPPIFKRFSNLHETILPSETDGKAIKATESYIPPTEINLDNLLIDGLMLEIPESSNSKTVSALNSSIDKTSVSCKFIINIKDEKENLKELSEKSRRLIVIQDYENKEGKTQC